MVPHDFLQVLPTLCNNVLICVSIRLVTAPTTRKIPIYIYEPFFCSFLGYWASFFLSSLESTRQVSHICVDSASVYIQSRRQFAGSSCSPDNEWAQPDPTHPTQDSTQTNGMGMAPRCRQTEGWEQMGRERKRCWREEVARLPSFLNILNDRSKRNVKRQAQKTGHGGEAH